MSQAYEIEFLCTDKGQHASRALALFSYSLRPDGESAYFALMEGDMNSRNWKAVPESERATKTIVRNGNITYRMQCPTCGRDIQMTRENAATVVTSTHAAGRHSVDVSRMP